MIFTVNIAIFGNNFEILLLIARREKIIKDTHIHFFTIIWQLEFLPNLRILAILKNIDWHEYIKAPWNYDWKTPSLMYSVLEEC